MCLIAFAWQVHPRYRLVLAANRDEFHARPALPLAEWDEAQQVIGGRDVLHGGGWLALRGRRLAAVTNVRRPIEEDRRSRGELVADFVRSDEIVPCALDMLARKAQRYRPFNLLMHDGDTLVSSTNQGKVDGSDAVRRFATCIYTPGIHGVSNGALDVPWPKTERLKERLAEWLTSSAAVVNSDRDPDASPLFDALADTAIASDAVLPDTGIGLERERFLSPVFITHPDYGTRASTVVLIADDHAVCIERRFGPDGLGLGETRIRTAFDP